jgi:hypothetical protein
MSVPAATAVPSQEPLTIAGRYPWINRKKWKSTGDSRSMKCAGEEAGDDDLENAGQKKPQCSLQYGRNSLG